MKKRFILLGICLFLHSTPAAIRASTLFRTLATTCAVWALLAYQVGAEDDNTSHRDQQQLTNETLWWHLLSATGKDDYGFSIEVINDKWIVPPNRGDLSYTLVRFIQADNGTLVEVKSDLNRYDDDISNEKALSIWQPRN